MRNVIVTGGSRGLGLAIATTLAAAGYRVIAIARATSPALTAAVNDARPGEIRFHAFDLLETRAIAPLIATLMKEFGPPYGLVNNAGLGSSGVLALTVDAEIERLVKLNTLSPMLLTKYVLRRMMSERCGRIVNISSITATSGYRALAPYSATKASLLGFTRSLAREVGELGITVNAIAPGFASTQMTQGLTESEREKIVRRSALRRLVEPADIAAAVKFLLSDDARNITGTTLTVDAGNTA